MYDQSHNLICEAKASLLSRKIVISSYRNPPKDQPVPYQAEKLNDIKTDKSMRILGRIFSSYTKCINNKFFR